MDLRPRGVKFGDVAKRIEAQLIEVQRLKPPERASGRAATMRGPAGQPSTRLRYAEKMQRRKSKIIQKYSST
ncbi:hypothetical protein [Paraburkholderia sp. HP33-1]|uniref:hypothetical protein n=1 Tax=Paraburkholderia sp. HP33-1 TaxID=2883243 RepID=UPI001F20E296|nr:hypothetical protein [Paraburkholderia sp. HP33-1]